MSILFFLTNNSSNSDHPILFYAVWGIFGVIILWLLLSSIIGSIKFKNADHTINPNYLKEGLDKDTNDDEMHEYYFHFYGKLNQSHCCVTKDKQLVYEMNKRYVSFLKAEEYDFINHVTNTKTYHEVGKTVTSSVGVNNFSTNIKSYFKFDGVNIWDYVKDNGFTHEIEFHGLRYAYNIFKEGKQIGRIEVASYKEVMGGNGLNIAGKGFYKVICKEMYLDPVLLYAFLDSKTEFSNQSINRY